MLMYISVRHLVFFSFLFLVLMSGVYFFITSSSEYEEFKVYDLKTLEQELPPATAREAIYTAFSLDEVKSKMTERHQFLTERASAQSLEFYWIATAEKTAISKTQDNQWHVVFRTNRIPSYICDVSFTDTSILQDGAKVICQNDTIK